MFIKGITAITIVLSMHTSFAQDFFKVAPYTLRHTNGHLILNMDLNVDKKFIIEDGVKVIPEQTYKKDEHYQIELSLAGCNVTKDLRIKDAETKKIIFSKNFEQPACASTKDETEYAFGFISDTQQDSNRHTAIAKVIAYHNSIEPLQFLINGGDIVQNGTIEDEWIQYFKGGQAYLMDVPQIAAIGNHDYRGNETKTLPQYFQKYLRWNGADANGNLFFEMPGFQLVIWNSNTPEFTSEQEKSMWAWLEGKMKAAQKSKTPFIMATHYPVYSSSLSRFVNTGTMKLRKNLIPLAEKYGVKLVLGGHTHMYERSLKSGVHYLVAGPAGGRPATKIIYHNEYSQMMDKEALTFTKIKYTHKKFNIETYNQDNALIDQLTLNL
jgi:predicted MPP superfamily phosphohydrolase